MRRFALALLPVLAAATACQAGSTRSAGGSPAYASPAPARTAPAPAWTAPAAAASAPASAPAGPPHWDAQNPTIEQALAGGRAAGKPVAVFLLASWCGYCRKLEAGGLQDATAHAEMANFYCVRVDPDSAPGRAYGRYVHGGFPTVTVLDATGNERANWPGNRPGPDLAAKLRTAR